MKTQKIKKYRWILMSVLILVVLVAATTIVLAERMTAFYQDDSGAIVINEPTVQTGHETNTGTVAGNNTSATAEFEVHDSEGEWQTETAVDIFRASYENGEGKITVISSDSEKVIAPGTDNAYTFKLKNTGDVPLEYIVDVAVAVTSDADIAIPVQARMNRYDGEWIIGGKQTFVDVLNIESIRDRDTLGAGRYTYYTFDWQWPFEQGADDLDTLLGNMTAEQELTVTIEIRTTAWTDADLDNTGGIISPQTGDDFNTVLWIAIGVCMLLMMFLLFFTRKREDEEEEEAQA